MKPQESSLILRDLQYYKFSAYGFLKNLRFFDPFILLFFRSLGFSYLQIGALFSIREISTTILEIPTGIIADWLGRKTAMICSFLAYIASFLVFYLFSSFGLFAIAMMLFSIGEAFRTGTHKAMILDYLKLKGIIHQKTAYYGHTRSWSQRGSALSSLIAGALVFMSNNYRIIFLVSIVPYIIELGLMISYPKELNGLSAVKTGSQKRFQWRAFFRIFTNSRFRRGVLNSSVYDGLFKSIKDYLQPVLGSFAVALPILLNLDNAQRTSIVVALIYFLIYLLSSYASRNAARFRNRFSSTAQAINRSFIIGIALTVLTGIFYQAGLMFVAIVIFIGLFALQNVRRPMNVSYISETIPAELMATGLSVESQLKTAIIAVLAPIIGYIADQLGVGLALAVVSLGILLSFPLTSIRTENADNG
ncbi:MAG: MFS transporter [Candidatus Marinimicrobia bacterium]|nr:MFS transporter [Candidatus Neomarinimicrobiota bacterium]